MIKYLFLQIIFMMIIFQNKGLSQQITPNCTQYWYNQCIIATIENDTPQFNLSILHLDKYPLENPEQLSTIAHLMLKFGRIDEAFSRLKLAFEKGYDNLELPRFKKYDHQWSVFERNYPIIKQKLEANAKTDIKVRLDKMLQSDQYIRDLRDKYPQDSALYTSQQSADTTNFLELKKIISDYGYPKYNAIGSKCMDNLNTLLLHFVMYEDFWSYLNPILTLEMKNNRLTPEFYAKLLDRRQVWVKNENQLYGTFNSSEDIKDGIFSPIFEINSIDLRRTNLGLMPLKYYAIQRRLKLPNAYVFEKYTLRNCN